MYKQSRFVHLRQYLEIEQLTQQTVLQYEHVKAKYERARTRCEVAATEYELMRVRQREVEKERVIHKEMLHRFRKDVWEHKHA